VINVLHKDLNYVYLNLSSGFNSFFYENCFFLEKIVVQVVTMLNDLSLVHIMIFFCNPEVGFSNV